MLRSNLLALFAGAAAAMGVFAAARAGAGVPPSAEQPAYDAAAISALVRQLGDASFRAREVATRRLIQVGAPAKAELLKALDSPDAEIRYRARLVLGDVLESDWRERLREFIEDDVGAREHDLPGWQRFRQQMGETTASRRLFAEMQRNEPALLEAADLGVEQAGITFDDRCQQLQEAMRLPGRQPERQASIGSIAALLFVGADSHVPINAQSAMYVTNFCGQQPFRQAAAGGETAVALKKLIGAWVQRDFGSDSPAMAQTLMLALQLNISEALEPAHAIINDAGSSPHMRQFAILIVGRFGGPDDVGRLEPLLSDEAICAQQQLPQNADPTQVAKPQVIETQVRDVALAVSVHLTGQKLADYGFTRAQPNATYLYNTATLGFTQPADRDTALSKWRSWRADQK